MPPAVAFPAKDAPPDAQTAAMAKIKADLNAWTPCDATLNCGGSPWRGEGVCLAAPAAPAGTSGGSCRPGAPGAQCDAKLDCVGGPWHRVCAAGFTLAEFTCDIQQEALYYQTPPSFHVRVSCGQH